MFWYSTIIREPALNLAKFIFMLKQPVKLRSYLLCGCVAACHGMPFVLHAVQMRLIRILHSMQPFHDMLPHNRIINNDVISPNVLTEM